MTIKLLPSDNAVQRKLLLHVTTRLAELASGKLYSLELIVGPAFWENEDDPHKALGIYFSDMVIKRRIPFEYAGWTNQRHNRYRYIGAINTSSNNTSTISDRSKDLKKLRNKRHPLAMPLYSMIQQISRSVPAGKPVSPRYIVGEPMWSSLDDAERDFAEQFIAAGVRLGYFEVTLTGINTGDHQGAPGR